jgi:hypothetical protein
MTGRAETGFIQLPRYIVQRFRKPFTRAEALIWLFAEASYRDRTRYVDNQSVKLKRGQLLHSIRFMAKAWGWSKSSVARFLAELKADAEIGLGQVPPKSGTGTPINGKN